MFGNGELGAQEGMFGIGKNEIAENEKAVERETSKEKAKHVENMFANATILAKSVEIRGNMENT